MEPDLDAVIIGGGAAGLSAAQMLGRSRRRTLVVDGGLPRNRFAAHVHGVLGHDGVEPGALLGRGRAEARAYGVEIVPGTVTALSDAGDRLRVTLADGTAHRARIVVIATGIRDELPPIPGLAEEWGRGVLHCPYCHGWEVAGQRLGVVAVSAASSHQIQLVRQLSAEVTAFTGTAAGLDEPALEALAARGIRVEPSPVSAVARDGAALVVRTDGGAEHRLDALFTAGAPGMDLAFAADLALARSEGPGSPLDVDLTGRTSHPRVFACGNVVAPFGTVPVATASGSMTGAGVNAALVAADVALAVAAHRGRGG